MGLFQPGTPGTLRGAFLALFGSLAFSLYCFAIPFNQLGLVGDERPYDVEWSDFWFPAAYFLLHALAIWRVARLTLNGYLFSVGLVCFSLGLQAWVLWVPLTSLQMRPLLAIPILHAVALVLLVAPPSTREMRRRIAAAREP